MPQLADGQWSNQNMMIEQQGNNRGIYELKFTTSETESEWIGGFYYNFDSFTL